MAYDIYGNILTKGYCEVHPGIPEEYPCFQCVESQKHHEEFLREQPADAD